MLGIDFDNIEKVQSNIPNRMFLLQCPSCGKQMKYKENLNTPFKASNISRKNKKCVFCNKNFKVHNNIIKEIK